MVIPQKMILGETPGGKAWTGGGSYRRQTRAHRNAQIDNLHPIPPVARLLIVNLTDGVVGRVRGVLCGRRHTRATSSRPQLPHGELGVSPLMVSNALGGADCCEDCQRHDISSGRGNHQGRTNIVKPTRENRVSLHSSQARCLCRGGPITTGRMQREISQLHITGPPLAVIPLGHQATPPRRIGGEVSGCIRQLRTPPRSACANTPCAPAARTRHNVSTRPAGA